MEETVEELLALIEARPADAELYQQLGNLHMEAGRLEEARCALERSLELDPNDGFTHLYLGNLFCGARQYSEALAHFQHGVELLPDLAVGHWCVADAHRAMGRYDLAQKAYETAVRVEPEDAEPHEKLHKWRQACAGITDQTLAMIRTASRNDLAATTVLLAARWLAAHPNDLWVMHQYAEMLYQMARYDEAIRVYLDAIDRFEDARWGLFNAMGQLHRYRGDFAAAEPWFEKAIAEDPDEAASYVLLGAVQARQGKLRQAEETHRRGTRCNNGPVDEAQHNLGLVLRGQGRLAEAADAFRKAIEISPDYSEAREALQDVRSARALSAEDKARSS